MIGGLNQGSFKILFGQNLRMFSVSDADLGRTHLTFHENDTRDARPIKMAL